MFEEIQEKLKKTLDTFRYEHSIGVMYTAGCLAMAHGYQNIEQAMLAGLLHDCAKCMTHEERLLLCQAHHVNVTSAELENRELLHAKAGAILAKTEYNIKDTEILHAIAVHTTGERDMSSLDKILYIADYIEPQRNKAPNLAVVRVLAYQNLDMCMAKILDDTVAYLEKRGGVMDSVTLQAKKFYQKYGKEFY